MSGDEHERYIMRVTLAQDVLAVAGFLLLGARAVRIEEAAEREQLRQHLLRLEQHQPGALDRLQDLAREQELAVGLGVVIVNATSVWVLPAIVTTPEEVGRQRPDVLGDHRDAAVDGRERQGHVRRHVHALGGQLQLPRRAGVEGVGQGPLARSDRLAP